MEFCSNPMCEESEDYEPEEYEPVNTDDLAHPEGMAAGWDY
jgi:hypothetical protein